MYIRWNEGKTVTKGKKAGLADNMEEQMHKKQEALKIRFIKSKHQSSDGTKIESENHLKEYSLPREMTHTWTPMSSPFL